MFFLLYVILTCLMKTINYYVNNRIYLFIYLEIQKFKTLNLPKGSFQCLFFIINFDKLLLTNLHIQRNIKFSRINVFFSIFLKLILEKIRRHLMQERSTCSFLEMVSLRSSGQSGTCFYLSASTSQVLELQVCTTCSAKSYIIVQTSQK